MEITVRQLALELGDDPRAIRGIGIGLRVRFRRTPSGDFISQADAARIRKAYAARAKLYKGEGKRPRSAVPA